MVTVMQQLGFSRFAVVGHDRGGRVAYRMALDHPDRVDRLAVLDVLPIETVWERADARFALAYWPWSLLAQPEPLSERILAAAAEAIVDNALGGWGTAASVFPSEVRAAYVQALQDHAHAPALYWSCGAPKERSIPGMSGRVDRSHFGKPGAMMFKDTRSMLAIFFLKRFLNKPSKHSTISSTHRHQAIGSARTDQELSARSRCATRSAKRYS